MDKIALRKKTIAHLKKLSHHEKQYIEEQLRNHLFSSPEWMKANVIGITIARGFEWDTREIIKQGWKQGKEIVVPKCYPEEKKLVFYRMSGFDEVETVYYNLLEPKPVEQHKVKHSSIDLVMVPGIVFNEKGYRIGFGGGYYDRFLSNYTNTSLSLLSTSQLASNLPVEEHDIPVNKLITEIGMLT